MATTDDALQLIVPMSGQGRRFAAAGHRQPKPLIDVAGRPMIARVLDQYPRHWPAHFVLAENHLSTDLPAQLEALRPGAPQHVVPAHEEGPGRALEAALPSLPASAPVVVSYCDFGLVWDAAQFARFVATSGCDACIVSYRGFQPHYARPTPYSYSRLDPHTGQVLEVREKACFTSDRSQEFAGAGAYYFRSAAVLKEALAAQRRLGLVYRGELYTSLTVEALRRTAEAADIRVFAVDAFLQWGTPEDLADYLYWHRAYAARLRAPREPVARVSQVVLPMAGVGSRFRTLTAVPKPMLPLAGVPMYERALASLPTACERQVIVTRESERAQVSARQADAPKSHVVGLAETPPGQALSTRAGLTHVRGNDEVLVSACDHAISLDAGRWQAFRQAPDCDAAIFTMRGYPGVARNPTHFAYVQPKGGAPAPNGCALLSAISVKRPLSDRPADDHVLVGTFWCASAALLLHYIDELVAQDGRVKGEFYLDSAFALMLADGRKVRQIPLLGYFNWGAPDALDETCYYERVFTGSSSHPFSPR